MAKTRAEIACAPYVDAWRDGFAAGRKEALQYALDATRAAWMDTPGDELEKLGKDLADELKRRQAA